MVPLVTQSFLNPKFIRLFFIFEIYLSCTKRRIFVKSQRNFLSNIWIVLKVRKFYTLYICHILLGYCTKYVYVLCSGTNTEIPLFLVQTISNHQSFEVSSLYVCLLQDRRMNKLFQYDKLILNSSGSVFYIIWFKSFIWTSIVILNIVSLRLRLTSLFLIEQSFHFHQEDVQKSRKNWIYSIFWIKQKIHRSKLWIEKHKILKTVFWRMVLTERMWKEIKFKSNFFSFFWACYSSELFSTFIFSWMRIS